MSYSKFQSFFCCRLLIVFSLIFGATYNTFPQTTECKNFDSYVQLDAERSKTQKEIAEIEGRIKTLRDKIQELENLEADLSDTNNSIKTLVDKQNKTDLEQQQLQEFNYDKSSLEGKMKGLGEGKSLSQLKDELKTQEDNYSLKQRELECIDKTLRKWLSPEGNFKFWVSVIFAILIGAVIIGFFWTAIKDDKVRQAVFAGQVGLQFIALFSIVIAIILFGITGILEAKELSALLGSIAGYILGRTMSSVNKDNVLNGNTTNNGNGGNNPNGVNTITNIEITPASITLTANMPTQTLTATATDAQGNLLTNTTNSDFQWESDDTSIATVDQTGLVTWAKVGKCNVTATANNARSTPCIVTCN